MNKGKLAFWAVGKKKMKRKGRSISNRRLHGTFKLLLVVVLGLGAATQRLAAGAGPGSPAPVVLSQVGFRPNGGKAEAVIVARVLDLKTREYESGTAFKGMQYTEVCLKVLSSVWGALPDTISVNLSTTIYPDESGCPKRIGGMQPLIWLQGGDEVMLRLQVRNDPSFSGNYDIKQAWIVTDGPGGSKKVMKQASWETNFHRDDCRRLQNLSTADLFALVERKLEYTGSSVADLSRGIKEYYEKLESN